MFSSPNVLGWMQCSSRHYQTCPARGRVFYIFPFSRPWLLAASLGAGWLVCRALSRWSFIAQMYHYRDTFGDPSGEALGRLCLDFFGGARDTSIPVGSLAGHFLTARHLSFYQHSTCSALVLSNHLERMACFNCGYYLACYLISSSNLFTLKYPFGLPCWPHDLRESSPFSIFWHFTQPANSARILRSERLMATRGFLAGRFVRFYSKNASFNAYPAAETLDVAYLHK